MNKSVDNYLIEGCGRCPYGGTSDCKVHSWTSSIALLRTIALDCGLTETCKWGVPCYTYNNKNILIISAFKDYCAMSFFKGALINNDHELLIKPGEHSQAVRLLKFDSILSIVALSAEIKHIISKAIEVEKGKLKINFKQSLGAIPEELEMFFEKDPTLKLAFEALTPGRRRGYLIYFSAPKQSKTKFSRIEKNVGKILNGEGLHDKYSRKNKRKDK